VQGVDESKKKQPGIIVDCRGGSLEQSLEQNLEQNYQQRYDLRQCRAPHAATAW